MINKKGAGRKPIAPDGKGKSFKVILTPEQTTYVSDYQINNHRPSFTDAVRAIIFEHMRVNQIKK